MKKTKEFIKKPKVIIAIVVALLSIAIITLLYSIYVNDKPAFIPEETKETVRGAIKEGIAEPIKLISKPLGEKISNAAWTKDKKENPGNSYGHLEGGNGKKDTKNWPNYTDPETGISIKYPEGWVLSEGDDKTISIISDDQSYDSITIYREVHPNLEIENWWNNKYEKSVMSHSLGDIKKIGNRQVYIYQEDEGMLQKYYVFNVGITIYSVLPVGEGYGYVEEIINNIK